MATDSNVAGTAAKAAPAAQDGSQGQSPTKGQAGKGGKTTQRRQPKQPSNGNNGTAKPRRGLGRDWMWADASDWENHRQRITELYRERGLHLEKVIEIMRNECNFHASARMYKTRISKWGIDKNYKAVDVACMLVIRERRAREGKGSEFFLRGRPVDWAKIEQYLKRDSTLQRRVNEGDDLSDLVPPDLNSAVLQVYSPAPNSASSRPLPNKRQQQQQQQQQQAGQQHQQPLPQPQQYAVPPQQAMQDAFVPMQHQHIVPSQSGAALYDSNSRTYVPSYNGALSSAPYSSTFLAPTETATAMTNPTTIDQYGRAVSYYAPTLGPVTPSLPPMASMGVGAGTSPVLAAGLSMSSPDTFAATLASLANTYTQSVAADGSMWYDETGNGQFTSRGVAQNSTHGLQVWVLAAPRLCSERSRGLNSVWECVTQYNNVLDAALLEHHPLLLCGLLHSIVLADSADAAAMTSSQGGSTANRSSLAATLSALFYSRACTVLRPDHSLTQLLGFVDRAISDSTPQAPQPWTAGSATHMQTTLTQPILGAFATALGSQAWVLSERFPSACDEANGRLPVQLAAVLRNDQAKVGFRADANAVSAALMAALAGQQPLSASGPEMTPSPPTAHASAPGSSLPMGPIPADLQTRSTDQHVLWELYRSRSTHTRMRCYQEFVQYLAEQVYIRQSGSFDAAVGEFFVGVDTSAAYTTTPRTSGPVTEMMPALGGVAQHRSSEPYATVYQSPDPNHAHQAQSLFYPPASGTNTAPAVSTVSPPSALMSGLTMAPATNVLPPVGQHGLLSGLMPLPDAAMTPRTTHFATGGAAAQNSLQQPSLFLPSPATSVSAGNGNEMLPWIGSNITGDAMPQMGSTGTPMSLTGELADVASIEKWM